MFHRALRFGSAGSVSNVHVPGVLGNTAVLSIRSAPSVQVCSTAQHLQ